MDLELVTFPHFPIKLIRFLRTLKSEPQSSGPAGSSGVVRDKLRVMD